MVLDVPIQKLPHALDLPYPAYATEGSSGLDLLAANAEPMIIERGKIVLVPTGIAIAVPPGFEAQIRPRSGLALKHGLVCVNAPGTIDADYRGEICVILSTLAETPWTALRGQRIAQLVFAPVVRITWSPVTELPETLRGRGGFGHTGV